MACVEKIAILTSGGDAPGMNAIVSRITNLALHHKWSVYWVKDGYRGLINNDFISANLETNRLIMFQGGTHIGSSRLPEFNQSEVVKKAVANLQANDITKLIVIGGDGTFAGARWLSQHGFGNIAMLPASIDNDVPHTDPSIGFMTSLNTVYNSIRSVRDTARSHNRCILMVTMGRACGQLSLKAGIAANADFIAIPECKYTSEDIINAVYTMRHQGKRSVILVITENQYNIPDLVKAISNKTGYETRSNFLDYVQRGGNPVIFDSYNAYLLAKTAIKELTTHSTPFYIGLQDAKIKITELNQNIKQEMDNRLLKKNQRDSLTRKLCKTYNDINLVS